MTFAKGLGNGMAIGGVVARGDLVDSVAANSISTFGGNPLATRGALATLDYLLSHDLQANANKIGTRLRHGLDALAERSAIIGEVRGKGLMIGIELVEPGSTRPSAAAAARVLEESKRGGLLIGKGGLLGNVLRIAPPLVVNEAEADEGLEILSAAITTVAAELA
jgi:4-aminobutyrate aminotransferase